MSDLIDRQALRDAMFHEAMEKFSYEQKCDSGCWIRYNMFERVLDSMPSVQPDPCEDAVSRSEIIRLILERGLYCDTQADREISADIIRQLPSVQPQRWIPCSERLPEVCDIYLVSGKMKYSHDKEWDYFVDVAVNYGSYIDKYWDTSVDWDEGQEIHIIAWMPLPEPWKGEEE